MPRQDMSLTIALCAALGVYSFLARYLIEDYTKRTAAELGYSNSIVLPTDARDRIGESTGVGNAIMESPGETLLEAKEAPQAQAFLSRDPEGAGDIGNEPTESLLAQSAPPASSEPAISAMPSAPQQITPRAQEPAFKPTLPDNLIARAIPKPPEKENKESAPTPPPAPPVAPVAPRNASPSQPTYASARAADPAPKSDSETDAFSEKGSVTFRPGKTTVQFGRKTKIIRPRLTLSAEYDASMTGIKNLVLNLSINEKGEVTNVAILQSSGSNDLDLPFKNIAYEWHFDPFTDKQGNPKPTKIAFTIRFVQ